MILHRGVPGWFLTQRACMDVCQLYEFTIYSWLLTFSSISTLTFLLMPYSGATLPACFVVVADRAGDEDEDVDDDDGGGDSRNADA